MDFVGFPKIPRLTRTIIVTEKIDGTNASIHIGEDGEFLVGSRNRFITPEDDNFGFAAWAIENRSELEKLGPGRHYGEWWGRGIGRKYDKDNREFWLFNTARWGDPEVRPKCCGVVPVLLTRGYSDTAVDGVMELLRRKGSVAAPGFMNPEGIVVYHTASQQMYKKTLEKDEVPKSVSKV